MLNLMGTRQENEADSIGNCVEMRQQERGPYRQENWTSH